MKNRQIFISNNWIKKNQKKITCWLQKNKSNFFYEDFNFKFFKNNIFINNYFYLLKKNNLIEKQLFLKILAVHLVSMYYFLSFFSTKQEKNVVSLQQLINELIKNNVIAFDFKNNYENETKIINDELYHQQFVVHRFAMLIGNLYAQSFAIDDLEPAHIYYKYGYYLVLIYHFTLLKNNLNLNKIWLCQSKLLVSYYCDETIKKFSPFIFNYFIIENNRMLKILKEKSWN